MSRRRRAPLSSPTSPRSRTPVVHGASSKVHVRVDRRPNNHDGLSKGRADNDGAATLASVFLPRAYFQPGGLAPEYLEFQAYDTLQGMCSYLRGVLVTRGLLRAYGVGDETASASAATLTWVARDGFGMIAGLWLAWAGARSFGANVKAWRLFADVANDSALVADLIAPTLAPGPWFVPLVCVSSALKAWCGVAAGATRAVITQHLALAVEDIADVQAKEGSQETGVTLLGMALGTLLVRQESPTLDWIMFWGLTVLHIWANLRAVRSLKMRDLNLSRLAVQCSHLATNLQESTDVRPMNFSEVAARERLTWWPVGPPLRVRAPSWEGERLSVFAAHFPRVAFDLESHPPAIVIHRSALADDVVAAVAFLLLLGSSLSGRAVSDIQPRVLDSLVALHAPRCVRFVDNLRRDGWDLEASRGLLGDSLDSRGIWTVAA